MRWGVYARGGFEGAEAWSQGLREVGCRGVERSAWDYGDGCLEQFDAIALFGLQGRGSRIRDEYEAAKIPVVIIDYGYLCRTNHAHDWRTGHWQVSVGGLNRLPRCEVDSSRFDSLGLQIAEAGGDRNGYTLLCVQTTGDASHGMRQYELQRWCEAQALRWPDVLIRPHPLEDHLDYGLTRCSAKTLSDALAGARLVVTGNSNSGHDALLAGVPAIATLPGAAWDALSGEHLPSLGTRLDHFHRCAWGQWTWSEFRAGLPQRFLLEHQLRGELK